MCQVENTPFEKTKAPIVCYKLLLIKSGRILGQFLALPKQYVVTYLQF